MLKNLHILFLLIFSFCSCTISAQANSKIYYKVAEGKSAGIWPHNDRFLSIERMTELKKKWGFDYLLLAAIYDEKDKRFVKEAGFDSLHIAYQIYLPDISAEKKYIDKLARLGKVWAYFFDEPISRDHNYLDFLNLIIFLSENGLYPHAKFIVSELDEKKGKKVLPLVDVVTYSGYGNSNKFGSDQAATWSEWKNYLGDKFGMPWISAQSDSNEYRTLFKAAKDLDFNFVWFYALEPLPANQEINDSNYAKFCEAAVEFGFMVRIDQSDR